MFMWTLRGTYRSVPHGRHVVATSQGTDDAGCDIPLESQGTIREVVTRYRGSTGRCRATSDGVEQALVVLLFFMGKPGILGGEMG